LSGSPAVNRSLESNPPHAGNGKGKCTARVICVVTFQNDENGNFNPTASWTRLTPAPSPACEPNE